MADLAGNIDNYLEAYSETDPARRNQLIADAFTADATLADPPLDAAGHDGLSDMFATVQRQFPNHTFARTSEIDEHHSTARYDWALTASDGTAALTGTDFVRIDADNRLTSVVGFFGNTTTKESQ